MNWVDFDTPGRLIMAEVEIVGPTGEVDAPFALDTGASRTVVSARVLRGVGYDTASLPRQNSAATAGGLVRVGMVPLVRMSTLGITVPRPEVLFQPLASSPHLDGLLGLDFFRGRVLTIDFARGRLRAVTRRWWHLGR